MAGGLSTAQKVAESARKRHTAVSFPPGPQEKLACEAVTRALKPSQ